MRTDQESDTFRGASQSAIYVIAATNRTGSYLLCEGLDATNVAGHPKEALTPDYRRELCQSLEGTEHDFSVSIKAMIRQGTTPNGVFGVKVHWDQVEDIALESGYAGPPYIFLLKEFPGARYIHLIRQDTLAQAISLSIAQQTDEWWRLVEIENPPKKRIEPVFNAAEILRMERDLVRQRDAWEAFFTSEGITPLRMDYETLVADYRVATARVLNFLGHDGAIARTLPEPRLKKQGNALNAAWGSWIKTLQEGSLR